MIIENDLTSEHFWQNLLLDLWALFVGQNDCTRFTDVWHVGQQLTWLSTNLAIIFLISLQIVFFIFKHLFWTFV